MARAPPDPGTQQLLSDVQRVEAAAEHVLQLKHEMLVLDRRRQHCREAGRALQKNKSCDKVWLSIGNLFVKLPREKATKLVKNDFNTLDDEIDKSRKELRSAVSEVRELEGNPELQGFDLNPLSKQDMASLEDML